MAALNERLHEEREARRAAVEAADAAAEAATLREAVLAADSSRRIAELEV